MYFDPFEKDLSSLDATDLERLRGVREGWYVEYKREPINAKAAAKSISAFANHFGGWLIFGVAAPERVPTGFPGLDDAECRTIGEALRGAVRHHANPVIIFESHEVSGPCESIGLPADRSILIVRILQGHNPPYIHSSGRIYRRIDDASDPKAETDRAVIDHLTQRSREYRQRFKERIERRPEFSDGESDDPCLQIFLTTDPWRDRTIKHVITPSEFSAIMTRRDDASYAMAFENWFPTAFGYAARHVGSDDPFKMRPTWNFSHSGFSQFTMPIRTLRSADAATYKYSAEFLSMLPKSLEDRVIDATALWLFLSIAIVKHDALAKAIGIEGSLFMKMRFMNVWRRVPYIDTQGFMDHVRANGIPVIQESEQITPPGTDPENMTEVKPLNDARIDPDMVPLVRAAQVLSWAFGAICAPNSAIAENSTIRQLSEIFGRAVRVLGNADVQEFPAS